MSELEALAADEGSEVGLAKEEGPPAEADDALAEAEGASVVITDALALALVSAELDAGAEGAALLSTLDATSEAAAEAEAENGGTVRLAETLGAESAEEDGAAVGRDDTASDELGRMLMTEEAALVAALSAVDITLETTAEEGAMSEALVDGKSVINGESEVLEAAGADESESDALAALEEGKSVIKGASEEATADAADTADDAIEAEAEEESAIELTILEVAAALADAESEAEAATLEIAELAEVGLRTSLRTELTAERSGAG
jgi:hypothetical protein